MNRKMLGKQIDKKVGKIITNSITKYTVSSMFQQQLIFGQSTNEVIWELHIAG